MIHTIAREGVLDRLHAAGVRMQADVFFPRMVDSEYAIPTKRWVTGPLSNAMWANMTVLGVRDYRTESNDCDDFARLTASLAQIMHHRSAAGRARECALAIGEFWYVREGGGGHAINVGLWGNESLDDPVEVFFYEPQSWAPVTLTPTELTSCLGCRF